MHRLRRLAVGLAIAAGCALCSLVQAGAADAARLNPFTARLARVTALASPRASAGPVDGSDALINDLSCTGVGDCSAAGDYLTGLGDQDGLLFTESGGVWATGVQATLPSNAASNGEVNVELSSISCTSPGNCTAVGEYSNTAQSSLGLLVTEAAGKWSPGTEIQLPANALSDAQASGGKGDNSELTSVSCWAVGDCTAVGAYEDVDDNIDGLVVTESGGVWSEAVEASLPTTGYTSEVAVLDAVSCLPGGICTASGSYTNASDQQEGWIVTSSAGALTGTTAITLPGDAASSTETGGLSTDPAAVGSSISCADADDCLVGGSYGDALYNTLPLLDEETGGVWASGSSPVLPATARLTTSGYAEILADPIYSVACPAAGDCTAVGWFTDADDNTQGLLLTEQAGIWTPVEAALPGNAATGVAVQTAEPGPVACSSAGNCVAASDYTDTVGNTEPLILTQDGYAWSTGYEPSLPANAGPQQQYGGLGDVSCPAGQDGDCTVIGIYQDTSENVQSFAVGESGGLWGDATELNLPSVSTAEVKLSLRPLLSLTGGDATLTAIAGAHAYTADFISLKAGKLTADWYERYGGHEQLIAKATRVTASAHAYVVKVELTPFGRQRLAAAKKLTVTAKAQFKPKSGAAVAASAKFKLT